MLINGKEMSEPETRSYIKQLETACKQADVQPVRRGHWKPIMMSEATDWELSLTGGRDEICEYNCSVCGEANILDEFGKNFLPPFCPWCGADMREEEGD